MVKSRAGRPKTTGWTTAHQAAKRLGISYYAMKQAVANGVEFEPNELFKISDKRILISIAAVERRVQKAE